jgi:hypothetical protein
MARTAKKTVGQAMQEVRELNERAAVNRALASYLRTRYLPRDAIGAQSKIQCLGSPVSEPVLEEMAAELEEGAKEMDGVAKSYEQTEFTE